MESVRIGRIALAAMLVLAAAWLFWPTSLGGRTTYVTTHGTSMQPRFHTGDLAILAPADSYSVGDVVAYHSATLKTTVMHRIIARDGDAFVTQGDSNSWADPDQPTADQILGTLWLRIPGGGKAVDALRSPWVLAALSAGGVALTAALRRPRARRRAGRRAAVRIRAPRTFSLPARARARQATLILSALTLVVAAGEAVLLLLPATQSGSNSLQVVQQGRFTYSGTAAPGTTYPTGSVTTGDPIFTRLVSGLTVSFTDVLLGADDVHGSVRLDVSVAAPDGWHAVVTSGPAALLTKGTATASVPLDHAAAARALALHSAEVGGGSVGATANGTLTVTPVVEVTGTAGGRQFTAGSPKGISFALDATALKLSSGDQAALTPITRTAVDATTLTARTLTFRGLTVSLPVARFTVALLLFGLLAGSGVAAWFGRSRTGDTADEFAVRHGARILPVTEFTPGGTVIDVAAPEGVYRVAERLEGLVLHHAGEDADTFAVQDGDTTYRCVVPRLPETVHVERRLSTLPPVPAGAVRNRFA